MSYRESNVISLGDMKAPLRLCYDINSVSKDIKDIKDKYKRIYKRWYDMHYRCYSDKLHERYPTYIGCEVCEEWHEFNNFLKWYQENYYEILSQKMDLDKDILQKGNKIYCPEYCIFVPHEINTMFVNGKNNRGDYPVGVSWDNSKNRFRAEVKGKKLGSFKTVESAFTAYKIEKEKQIKELAKKYRGQIQDGLYDAMMHWKVEITD